MSQIRLPVLVSTFYSAPNDLVVVVQGQRATGKSSLIAGLLNRDKENSPKNYLFVADDPTTFIEEDGKLSIAERQDVMLRPEIGFRVGAVRHVYAVPSEQFYYNQLKSGKPVGLVVNLHRNNGQVQQREPSEYLSSPHNCGEIFQQFGPDGTWMHYVLKHKIPVIDLGLLSKDVSTSVTELSDVVLKQK
jgi:hypothetical protein